MTAFKGSPGPWEVEEDDFYENSYIRQKAGTRRLSGFVVECRICENVANDDDARLIAAAPDSHEANVKFIEAIECLCNVTAGWTDDRIYDELPSSGLAIAYFAARAAIAKATGGDA